MQAQHRNRHGRNLMVVGFTTIYGISAYHHYRFEFESLSWRGVLDTTSYDKVCQFLRQVRCFLRVLRLPPPVKLTATIRLKYC